MPAWVAFSLLGVYAIFLISKKPLENFVQQVLESFAQRMRQSSKTPATELARKARKAVVLEQTAERQRISLSCDHVSVYAVQNGEYLRTGEGIDKFVMQAEASQPGDPRYMDVERMIYAQDIPRTVLALDGQPYLLLWPERSDDWKVNKLMKERDYASSIAVFIRRPMPGGGMGVIGMYVVSWRECEVYRPDQTPLPAHHRGPIRLLDPGFEKDLAAYALEYSYTM